jgi:gluconokinase
MEQKLILTIDVGTSSVRAMLFDAAGDAVPGMEAQRVHQMQSTADGGVEADAGVLFDRLAGCIDDVLHLAGDRAASLQAVALTTFWHSLVGVSARAAPVTPVLTWADTRAMHSAQALRDRLDVAAVHARTGCTVHASYWPAKLVWLYTESPWKAAVAKQVSHWLSFADYVLLRLFGVVRCSISMASATGMLDQATCTWDADLAKALPLDPAQLPTLSDQPCSGLAQDFARRWPALARIPWVPAWGDGATSNVGSGCVTKQRVAMMVGTSAAMRAVWRAEHFSVPADLWCYRVDAKRVVMGGALSNGGNFIDWLRVTLRLADSPADLEAAIGAMEPDQAGITILPFLAGERSTGWHAEARATFSGLALHTSPLDVYRAGHEAIAYRFDLVLELLRGELGDAFHVVASGGALLHSPAWLQIMADVLGTPVIASAVYEASSRGAALLALEALGVLPDVAGIGAPEGTRYVPNLESTRTYRRAAERQHVLYRALIG